MKITREQILCVAAGLLLSAASFVQREDFLLENDDGSYRIERPDYGNAAEDHELFYETETGREKITVSVSSRMYSAEESEALFEQMIEPATAAMLSVNTDITEITEDLSFVSSLPGYPGITVSWKSDDPVHIGTGGEILNDDVSEPLCAVVKVTFSSETLTKTYEIPVIICPDNDEGSASEKEGIEELIFKADKENGTERFMVLPEALYGRRLKYSEPFDASPLILLAMGVVSALLLRLKPVEDEKKRKKERENELLLDYSDIVSKLIVYIGAGLTVRNAWEKLASEHEGEKRAVYSEIAIAASELKNGETENRVYLKFAKRCGLRCYTRLASLLDQNSKTGDDALLTALELEMDEAFEQRKNTARRLGEEAGTKLILPLMMLLVTVLVMVASPALFTLI